MARYSDIDNSIWEELQQYSKNAKLLYIYAFSNALCRESGLYKISLQTILMNTKLREKEFDAVCAEIEAKIAYDKEEKVMFVGGKLKRRLAGLSANPNLLKAIEHDLKVCSPSFCVLLFLNRYEEVLKGLIESPPRDSIHLHIPLHIERGVGKTKPLAKKVRFLEFVLLTEEEHRKLVDKFGDKRTQELIEILNNGIGAKGYKYKSHYHALLNWEKREVGIPKSGKPVDNQEGETLLKQAKAELGNIAKVDDIVKWLNRIPKNLHQQLRLFLITRYPKDGDRAYGSAEAIYSRKF